jgi:hypothetical protein
MRQAAAAGCDLTRRREADTQQKSIGRNRNKTRTVSQVRNTTSRLCQGQRRPGASNSLGAPLYCRTGVCHRRTGQTVVLRKAWQTGQTQHQ